MLDGYHCISIHPYHKKFNTTFQLPDGELIQMSGLPFGLSASPHVFCKVMQTMVRALQAPSAPMIKTKLDLLRRPTPTSRIRGGHAVRYNYVVQKEKGFSPRKGLRILPYKDDFLCVCKTREEAFEARDKIEGVLSSLGLARTEPCEGLLGTILTARAPRVVGRLAKGALLYNPPTLVKNPFPSPRLDLSWKREREVAVREPRGHWPRSQDWPRRCTWQYHHSTSPSFPAGAPLLSLPKENLGLPRPALGSGLERPDLVAPDARALKRSRHMALSHQRTLTLRQQLGKHTYTCDSSFEIVRLINDFSSPYGRV